MAVPLFRRAVEDLETVKLQLDDALRRLLAVGNNVGERDLRGFNSTLQSEERLGVSRGSSTRRASRSCLERTSGYGAGQSSLSREVTLLRGEG